MPECISGNIIQNQRFQSVYSTSQFILKSQMNNLQDGRSSRAPLAQRWVYMDLSINISRKMKRSETPFWLDNISSRVWRCYCPVQYFFQLTLYMQIAPFYKITIILFCYIGPFKSDKSSALCYTKVPHKCRCSERVPDNINGNRSQYHIDISTFLTRKINSCAMATRFTYSTHWRHTTIGT